MLDEKPVSQIAREYETLTRLFDAQPVLTRHFLEQQSGAILSVLDKGRIHFQLPDKIILEGGEALDLPPAARSQAVGHVLGRYAPARKRDLLRQHLDGLENSLNPALSLCGKLFRYALAHTLVHTLLPDGRAVQYQAESGDDIPSIPLGEDQPSALLAATDAVTEADLADPDTGRLQVPYAAAARRFYLPQWVAFGEDDQLLTGSVQEAEAQIASLQNAVCILQEAEAFCPSVVADEIYQRKRAGLLGQLVNQGRALARYYTREIIVKIRARAEAGSLNRGLRLNLPYFDDGMFKLEYHKIDVIPDGRIMFLPAFVVRAIQMEKAKVRHSLQLNQSTRRHLLLLLAAFEQAFTHHPAEG